MRAAFSMSAVLRVQPSAMFCGNTVAPMTLLWPCTASTPYMSGMCRRDRRARDLIFVIHVSPGNEIVAGFRVGIAAAQDGAEAVVGDVVGILDEELVRLRHLADFFVERHLVKDGAGLSVVTGENAGANGSAAGACEKC